MKFYAWVTMLSESAVDLLLSGLVLRGYTVGPLSKSQEMFSRQEGQAAYHVAMNLERVKAEGSREEDPTNQTVLRDIRRVLNDRHLLYYSVIVSAPTSCTWDTGNIDLRDAPTKKKAKKVSKEKDKSKDEGGTDAWDHLDKDALGEDPKV
jgi:hypothetical protein